MPRFKMDYDVKLNDALTALGMGEAFSGAADFSGIADSSVKIDEVKQKTFVEVNEEGTEAAAVTSVVVAKLDAQSVNSPPPFQMIDCGSSLLLCNSGKSHRNHFVYGFNCGSTFLR